MQTENVCKKIVRETVILEERKVTHGVITGLPVVEDLERLKQIIDGGNVSGVKRVGKNIQEITV